MRQMWYQARHLPVDLGEVGGLAVERQLINLTNVQRSYSHATHGIKPDTYQLTWVRLLGLAVKRQLTNLTNVQSSCASATRGIKQDKY